MVHVSEYWLYTYFCICDELRELCLSSKHVFQHLYSHTIVKRGKGVVVSWSYCLVNSEPTQILVEMVFLRSLTKFQKFASIQPIIKYIPLNCIALLDRDGGVMLTWMWILMIVVKLVTSWALTLCASKEENLSSLVQVSDCHTGWTGS